MLAQDAPAAAEPAACNQWQPPGSNPIGVPLALTRSRKANRKLKRLKTARFILRLRTLPTGEIEASRKLTILRSAARDS